MIFPSFAFLFLFLPTFLAGYFAVGARFRNLWLLLCSFVFYGWDKPWFVLIMLASTLFDYTVGRLLGPIEEGRRHRKLLLVLSVVVNLGLLAWFKYANFFVYSTKALTGATFAWTEVALPVGISFYTFQSMSYTIDVYRGEVKPTRSLVDFACYVAMFPQLVAGPIVRYRDVAAQLRSRVHSLELFGAGAVCFAAGFCKKVMLADVMDPIAKVGLALPAPGLVESWTTLVAYTMQIYFDFSGYSDMAVGLGLMLGFRFPKNFDAPYLSQSITEAWRRWHISLSTWLRDYLYIPLGGNRRGRGRTYVNLMLTMLLGGLWHGANWPFVLWGAYHGLWLCIERMRGGTFYSSWPRPVRIAITWLIFSFGWSMFISNDLARLCSLWSGLSGLHGVGGALRTAAGPWMTFAAIAIAMVVVFAMPTSHTLLRRFSRGFVIGITLLFVVALAHGLAAINVPFLYFRF